VRRRLGVFPPCRLARTPCPNTRQSDRAGEPTRRAGSGNFQKKYPFEAKNKAKGKGILFRKQSQSYRAFQLERTAKAIGKQARRKQEAPGSRKAAGSANARARRPANTRDDFSATVEPSRRDALHTRVHAHARANRRTG